MAAKGKKGGRIARSADRRKQLARVSQSMGQLAEITPADFERTVIYRGIKIEPTMAVGERSPLARAIRDELRKKSEQFIRGKLQQLSVKSR
jgi:hypothetical protein